LRFAADGDVRAPSPRSQAALCGRGRPRSQAALCGRGRPRSQAALCGRGRPRSQPALPVYPCVLWTCAGAALWY